MAGKPWYNNGEIEIQRNPNKEEIPKGFIKGRLPLKEDSKNKLREYHKNLSQLQKQQINEKRSKTLKFTYETKSEEQRELHKQLISKGLNARSDIDKASWRQHISDNTIGKNSGNIPWNKNLTKETDQRLMMISEHNSIVLKEYYATLPPEYFKEWRAHMRKVAREKNSYRTSRAEENLYLQLCEEYGKENVIRQYRDEERYPFDCDFYITTEDLFIELNKHPSHGPHPFNKSSNEDLQLLEKLKSDTKTPKWNKMIIEVWTKRDVIKFQTAKKNNLNYLTIY